MAKNDIPELVKIIVNKAGSTAPKASLEDLKSDIATIERVVESAKNTQAYTQSRLRDIDTHTGLYTQEFLVQKSDVDNVYGALQAKLAQLTTKRGLKSNKKSVYNLRKQAVPTVSSTTSLHGVDAFNEAKANLNLAGGDIWRDPTKKNPDRVRYFYPYENLDIATKQEKAKKTKSIFGKAKKTSAKAVLLEKYNKEEAVAKENFQQENKQNKEESKKTFSIWKSVLSTVTAIADITRRILTSALQTAVDVDKGSAEAHAVNVSYAERRNMDLFDIGHNLASGTSFNAVNSTASMFGNLTMLDEGALSKLAIVMGNKIGDLVRSGLGVSNPQALTDEIIGSYFENYKKGIGADGISLGSSEEARKSLYNGLKTISAEYALLFNKAVDSYDPLSPKFNTYEEFRKSSATTNRPGLTDSAFGYVQELGAVYGELKASWKDIKDSILTKIVISLDGILNFLSNSRFMMSDSQSLELDRKNREINKNFIKEKTEQFNKIDTFTESKLTEELTSDKNLPSSVQSVDFLNRAKLKMSTLQNAGNAKKLASSMRKLYKNNPEEFKETYGDIGDGFIEAYATRANEIYKHMSLNKDLRDDFYAQGIISEKLDEAKKEFSKKLGEKINKVTLSNSALLYKANDAKNDDLSNLNSKNMLYDSLTSNEQEYVKNIIYDSVAIKKNYIANAVNNRKKGIFGIGGESEKKARERAEKEFDSRELTDSDIRGFYNSYFSVDTNAKDLEELKHFKSMFSNPIDSSDALTYMYLGDKIAEAFKNNANIQTVSTKKDLADKIGTISIKFLDGNNAVLKTETIDVGTETGYFDNLTIQRDNGKLSIIKGAN